MRVCIYAHIRTRERNHSNFFSRREMLHLVLVLGNKYVNQPAMNILYLMADNNWCKRYTYFRLGDYLERHQFDGKKYIVCF